MSSAPPNAFLNAVERARAVAAKLSQNQTVKRPADEDPDNTPDAKRSQILADPFGAQLAAMRQGTASNTTAPGTAAKLNQYMPNGMEMGGEKSLDMIIPGTKVGYIIGKGGEQIRQLQERANVKMTVIQSSAEATEEQKQLRIVGEPSRVDYAVQLVNDLLTEKELESAKLKNRSRESGMTNDYGSGRAGGGNREIQVPPQYIGLVIGKGGENIKRIQAETNTKVQFEAPKSDPEGNKVCIIQGHPDAVRRAADMVQEIIDNAINSKGRVRGRNDGEEVRMNVPPNKTGIVIGKGGETIRSIKQQSGCDIELDKNSKGVFILRGPSDRIQYAQQLINDRVHGQHDQSGYGMHGMGGKDYHQSPYGDPYRDKQSQHSMPQQNQQYWAGNYWQGENSQNPTEAQNQLFQDPNRAQPEAPANQDTNAAAYYAYYAQYYAGAQQQMAAGVTPTTPTSNGNSGGAPQQDYSAQWAEYYRAYGMVKEAEMIENMAKQMREQSGQQAPQNPSQSTNQPAKESESDKDRGLISYPGYNYGGASNQTQ